YLSSTSGETSTPAIPAKAPGSGRTKNEEKQFIFGPGASKMDSWTFTVELMKASAAIITALAWPAVVFGIVYLFRTGRIRAKYGKWKLWLDKAEKTAEGLQEPPANAIAPPTPEEEQRFSELVKESPREVILAKRTKLEEAIVSYAEAKELAV